MRVFLSPLLLNRIRIRIAVDIREAFYPFPTDMFRSTTYADQLVSLSSQFEAVEEFLPCQFSPSGLFHLLLLLLVPPPRPRNLRLPLVFG